MNCCSSRPARRRSQAQPELAAAALVAAVAPELAEAGDSPPPAEPAARTTTAEVKRVRANIRVKVPVGASAQQAAAARTQAHKLLDATDAETETEEEQEPEPTEGVPPARTASLDKDKDTVLANLRGEHAMPSTPQSTHSAAGTDDSFATPQQPASMPPVPTQVVRTPDWMRMLKGQGMDAGMVGDSLRVPHDESVAPPPSVSKLDESMVSIAETSEDEDEDMAWASPRSIAPEPSPVAAPVDDTLLCKIEVAYNPKFGDWNAQTQGKLYAQFVAAGTDEVFAQKVVLAMKQNKGKVSVRGPMVNHAPAYTVFRSIPALTVGLSTPSKVDQSGRRMGKAAPPPLRTAGPCAVTRLPGEKAVDAKSGGGGFLRRNKKGVPIVKARTISPPRARITRTNSAGGAPPTPGLPGRHLQATTSVAPIDAARSLFDRNGRPRSDPNFEQTPIARSNSTASVSTPSGGSATPRVGVRALRSPARLVAESFQRGVNLQGREFKVLTETTVTKLVMPSSSDVTTLRPGMLVSAIDNQWWHGPRIKLQLPAEEGGGTGWVSLCSTHGDYMLIPVVDAVTAAATQQENDAPAGLEGIGAQIPARKTARRALGMVLGANGQTMSTPDARAAKLATNSMPMDNLATPGRDGDI